jgi:hypothetical protein
MREIKIGDRPMRSLTGEDLRRIVMIEGCCPGLEYWGEPVVSCFDNTMFRDCCVIEYSSVRKSDGVQSIGYSFYFKYDCGGYFYVKDPFGNAWQSSGYRPSLAALGYLISEGFDIPL